MKRSNKDHDAAFTCGNNSNFQMTINGFRISIAFGPGCYVSDRDIRFATDFDTPTKHLLWGSDDAEVMIWGRDGNTLFTFNDGILNDQVMGRCNSDTVARMIGCLASAPAGEDVRNAIAQIYSAQQ